jgi:hypothetical protein
MSIHVNSSLAVALVQSRLLGDTKGGPFNDIETGELDLGVVESN